MFCGFILFHWILFSVAASLLLLFTEGYYMSYRVHFRCSDGTAIRMYQFCNGIADCPDGSDEISYLFTNMTDTWSLCMYHNAKACFVPREKICNNEVNCASPTPCDLGCDTTYLCQNGKQCKSRDTVCNGNICDDCPEGNDWAEGVGFKCMRKGEQCILPQQLLRDDIPDCDGGLDLCFNTDSNGKQRINRTLCFQCLDDVTVVASSSVCDGKIDCPDLSDECLCEETPSICRQVIMNGKRADQPTFPEKESIELTEESKNLSVCEPGEVMCLDGKCIQRKNVCDGKRECQDDESIGICGRTLQCRDARNEGEVCRCERTCKPWYGVACDDKIDCPLSVSLISLETWEYPHPEDECAVCSRTAYLYECDDYITRVLAGGLASLQLFDHGGRVVCRGFRNDNICNGIPECGSGLDEENCDDRYECEAIEPGFISIPLTSKCNGIDDCLDGADESYQICNKTRFPCPALGGTRVSIPRDAVCDARVDCDDKSDEINCTDERFYCENGDPLFIRKLQKFDKRKDCSDWSDECPLKNTADSPDVFSSRYELIGNPILRALVWIMGLFSFAGNLVIVPANTKRMLAGYIGVQG